MSAAEEGLRISPTAHYTSYVWFRNGLSHPSLASDTGRRLYRTFRPIDSLWHRLDGGAGLEPLLLARHRTIDALLGRAIEAGDVAQVVEVAAGYSPRGLRFSERYPELRYVEGDLGPVAAAKRERLDGAGLRGPKHDVRTLDLLRDDGPDSLSAAVSALDRTRGIAIVAEGLLGYLDRPTVEGVFRRIARALEPFPRGVFVSDVYLADELAKSVGARTFRLLLGAFVRGRTHSQADDAPSLEATLRAAGFARTTLHVPNGVRLLRILEAHVG